MENEHTSRLGIALAVSLGLHVFVGICAEVASSPASEKKALAPPVEIERIAMDGSTMPAGPGDSSFNSRASVASPGFGQKYGLDAGVPTKIPIPPKTQENSTPEPRPVASQDQFPRYAPPTQGQGTPSQSQPQSQPRQNPTNQEFLPPLNQGSGTGNAPPSSPSQPSTAGNQGQKRSRGPNRIAFPEFTVEPQVPQSLLSGGVVPSVDVTVDVGADGSHTERIVRSSGSEEVDRLVMAALKQWRWDPAAREGQPIASTQNFKFNFKPR